MHTIKQFLLLFGLPVLTLVLASCRESEEKNQRPNNPQVGPKEAELVFPESVRVADETVNSFVRTALTECARGDYDAFRALWTARQEPISRNEFEEGWHAVNRVEVRALRKAMLAADQPGQANAPVHVLLVEVALDPQRKAGKRAPHREVVLMLVQEQVGWRMAFAPKDMREWIKAQVASNEKSAEPPGVGMGAP